MKKEIFVLVGPAAIGKSTYTKNLKNSLNRYSVTPSFAIINRDDVVGNVIGKYGFHYDEIYNFPPKDAIPGTFISGKENFGKVIESPSVVKHLQPFSFEYLDSINAEINYTFYNEFQAAIRKSDIEHIVIDRVHMRSKERLIYFDLLEPYRENFNVTAVLFNFKDEDTLDVIEKVSALRTRGMEEFSAIFRTVPRQVQENMIKHYEEPTIEEGFDSIIHIDTLPELRKLIQ